MTLVKDGVVSTDAVTTDSDIDETSGTYSHSNGVAEQDAIVLTITEKTRINNFYLDLVNLTQSATLRVKVKVDGTNYQTLDTLNWTTSNDDGVLIHGLTSDVDVKVTIQSAIAEGASRDIPYRVL